MGQLGVEETSEEPQCLPITIQSLTSRIVTQVEVGMEFCIALGQDLDASNPILPLTGGEDIFVLTKEESENAEEQEQEQEQMNDETPEERLE